MKVKNSNLHKAKNAKNDEFYTMFETINKELQKYRPWFKGKVVLCNCDDSKESNFYQFFLVNFKAWGIKKLITTHYSGDKDKPAHKREIYIDENGEVIVSGPIKLTGNGDFRNQECIALLKEADVVVTNPPFSLFREYVAQLMDYKKKFLILGSQNAITYKEIFPLIKANKLWLGVDNGAKSYIVPESYEGKCKVENGVKYATLGNTSWFTNLQHDKRNEEIFLFREYSEEMYPTYDNYDAIEVSKVTDIPMDYDGVMGVPITFLTKYNPSQFDIVRFRKGADDKDLRYFEGNVKKEPYFRILIKRKG